METFAAFWTRLCDRNPPLLDSDNKLTLSVASFKLQLERAYQAGRADAATTTAGLSGISDLFGDIFGAKS